MFWIYLLLMASMVVVAVDAASPGRNGKQLAKLAARMSLPLTPEVEPLVRARLRRRAWGVGLGGGLALVVVLGIGLALPELRASAFAAVAVFFAGFAGMGVGAASAAAVAVPRPAADEVRVARAAPPRVSDYVGPSERIGPRVVAGLALAAFVVGGVVAVTGLGGVFVPLSLGEWVTSAAGATTLVAVAALVAAEVAMARLVDRGQPAMSELDLAWDDALRSMALRDLVTAPVVLGFVGVVGSMIVLGDAASGGGAGSLGNLVVGALGLSIVLLFALSLGLAVWATTTKPHLHWWRTLWEPRRPMVSAGASSAPAAGRRP
jgi:hypothetical protein